jgi:membrane protein DedA with SNARE-associated domain
MKPSSLVLAALVAVALALLRKRLTRTQLALGGLVAAWLLVRGVGVVEMPDLEETAKEIGPALGGWMYVAVGVMAFLETAFFVGLIAPGEFTVVLGGFVAGQGVIDVTMLAVVVFACAAAGDTTGYVLGRRLGRPFLLRHGRSFWLTERRLDQVDGFIRRHGKKTILIGRFVGVVRAVTPFIAGASRVPAARFLPIDYLAAAAWSATFVTLGYVFWQSFDTVVSAAKSGTFALGGLVALVVVGTAAFRWLEDRENRRRLRRAWRMRSLEPLTGRPGQRC